MLKLFLLSFLLSFFYSVNISGIEIKDLKVAIKKMEEETNGLLSSEDDLRYCIDIVTNILISHNKQVPSSNNQQFSSSYSDYVLTFMNVLNSLFDLDTYYNDVIQCDDLICFEKIEIFFDENKELAYQIALKYKKYLEDKKNYYKTENNISNNNKDESLKNKLDISQYCPNKNKLPKTLFEKFYSKKQPSDIMIIEKNNSYVVLYNFKIKEQRKNASIKNDFFFD